MRLYLIRHGITLPQGPDSHSWPLSSEGEKQSEELANAPFWSSVAHLYSSPEEKALSTVLPASEAYDLTIVSDERLREAHRPPVWYDDYESVVRNYLRGTEIPSSWEHPSEVVERVSDCISDLTLLHPTGNVAVCGHGLMFTLYLAKLEPHLGVFDLWRATGFGEVAVLQNGDIVRWFGSPADVVQ